MTRNAARATPWPQLLDFDLFTAAPDGIIIVDEHGTMVMVNDQIGEMFGYAPAELVGVAVERLLPEHLRAIHVEQRAAFITHPTRRAMGPELPLFGRRKNGEEFPVEVGLNHQQDASGHGHVVAFVRDATLRRRMEAEVRAGEDSFRLLVDGVGDHAIFMLDMLGRVVTWNPGAQRIKGWASEDILGRHFSVFYTADDIASGLPERDLERAASVGRVRSEGWRVRADGQRFWAETTLSALKNDAGVLRGFAKVTRDRTESRQARARLESVAELNRAVLEQRSEEDLLALVVSRARALVGASIVAAWTLGGAGDQLVVAYAEGEGAAALLGTRAPDDSLITIVARTGQAADARDVTTDLRIPRELSAAGMRSGSFVALHAAGETFAVLGIMMASGRQPMPSHETDLIQAFAAQAAASFAHARARREADQLHLVSDRERIARDLHDTVIQRLFAVGLSLEAAIRRPHAETDERLHRAVADIDDTIRSIRSSIFSLEARPDDQPGLRSQVLEVVAEVTPALGFEPSVRFEGPVDTLTNAEITENLVATLREALANVARHAAASLVRVTIAADDDIVLIVDDDGVGAEAFEREGGHGVSNLSERARTLGGRAALTHLSPSGTRVDWRVPTPS